MKLLVLYSLLFVGVVSNTANAAQPIDKRFATSSQTSTVSLVKTDAIEFVGKNDILLQQTDAGKSSAVGFTSICVSSLSNTTKITLSTANEQGFMLTEDTNGSHIPYSAQLLAAPSIENTACPHGQHYKLNFSIPGKTYNTALPGNYTDTITLTIAAE